MRQSLRYSLLFSILFIVTTTLQAQQFNGSWSCDYATTDNDANGTGYNTVSVGVVNENNFVALVTTTSGSDCYLVGYLNADSTNGKLGNIPYAPGYLRHWAYGFDDVAMYRAMDLYATPDSLVYVANNGPGRNILVFKLTADSVEAAPYRLATGADSLWAIHVDDNGTVYVSSIKTGQTPSEVLIFKGIKDDESSWGSSFSGTPVSTITLPDTGEIRGVTTNSDGSVVYVSNYSTKKIYCYTGTPTGGYTLSQGFNFTLKDTMTASTGTLLEPGPWGLHFMKENNILFAACDVNFMLGGGYEYGRIYALNPNTGEILDTINTAEWNFDHTGAYNSRSGGTVGDVSGYTSTYNVRSDEKGNIYDQSFYGWTVDKWTFSGTLPTIPLTITGIEKDPNSVPEKFSLAQNYPNPFNPTTTIEFSVNKSSSISLSVYDINGRLVSRLIDSGNYAAGTYRLSFDASRLASGTYIYVLNNGIQQLSRKMTLIK